MEHNQISSDNQDDELSLSMVTDFSETSKWVRKWDAYIWSDDPVSRLYKTTQHLSGSWVSTRTLFTFRIFAFFCLWLQWLFDLYWQCTYTICIEVQYFTIWG